MTRGRSTDQRLRLPSSRRFGSIACLVVVVCSSLACEETRPAPQRPATPPPAVTAAADQGGGSKKQNAQPTADRTERASRQDVGRARSSWWWTLPRLLGIVVALGVLLVTGTAAGLLLLIRATTPPPPVLPPVTNQRKGGGRKPLPPAPPAPPPLPSEDPDPTEVRHVPPALFVRKGRWKVVAASVAGTSHSKKQVPCQDAAYCRVLAKTILVGAVADGAGSAAHSDEGSQIAVKKAVDTLADNLERSALGGRNRVNELTEDEWHQLLRTAMQIALVNIELRAAMHGAPPREFATTLLLFAALPHQVIAAQVGDGAVVIRDARGAFRALTTPQTGEYANQTTFLTSPNAAQALQHQAWHGTYSGIAAFTDGLQRLALSMPQGVPHSPFFTPLFDFAERAEDAQAAMQEIDAFLRSGKVTERADDDLTLMVARVTS